ncbi:MAG TPA: ammonium transporter [Syntrophales bacterium]|nr:ammonium transporter [Syntrophobacterales bacterium]HRR40981.1 ammonium transporter [Syntrophales bacterium]HRT70966.1 ammonium transporter [Syntrophales bacterium]
MNSGDTAWVLISSALVLIMTPGLAFFYGGMARKKNVLSLLMQCFFIMCLIGVQWVVYGYSLAFGPDVGGIIGSLDWAFLHNVGLKPFDGYSKTIPHLAFMVFQSMFAVITPALIIGAFAERIKFSAFVVFTLLWATLVYDPIAHWVWGNGGWLKDLGALDFAGGIVVHVSSGISALVMCLLIGKRIGYEKTAFAPHNLPFTVLGGALLWFGWFGFNAGSALAADGIAANAFVTTNTATAAAGFSWALLEWIKDGAPTVLGVVSGAVAGLVAITPACGYVSPTSAIIIGIVAGVICCLAVTVLKQRLGYDDSLDVFGVHCVGGTWGTLATGLFAQKVINEGGADGLFFGNPQLLLNQGIYFISCIAYAAAMAWVLFKLVDVLIGVRVEKKDELIGLDLTQHNEAAYTVLE